MKNQPISAIIVVLFMFGFASCVKQVDMPADPTLPAPTSGTAENFSDIKTSDSFNWSTTRKVNLTFNGSANADYQLVLKVTDPEGNVVMQKLQKASETFTQVLEMPTRFESLTISYGSTTRQLDSKSGSVSFSIN